MSTISKTLSLQLLGICSLAVTLYQREDELAKSVVQALGFADNDLPAYEAANDALFGTGLSAERKLEQLLKNFELTVEASPGSQPKQAYTLGQLEQARQFWSVWITRNFGENCSRFSSAMAENGWHTNFYVLNAWVKMDAPSGNAGRYFMQDESLYTDRDHLISEAVKLGLVLN